MSVCRYLKVHERMIDTVALSRLLLLRPADEFAVVVFAISLYGPAAHRKMSLFGNRYILRPGYNCNGQQQCRYNHLLHLFSVS